MGQCAPHRLPPPSPTRSALSADERLKIANNFMQTDDPDLANRYVQSQSRAKRLKMAQRFSRHTTLDEKIQSMLKV